MKIVKLKAGLGNQMFEYAFICYLQKKYNIDDIKVDNTYYNNKKFKKYWDNGIQQFDLSLNIATEKEVRKFKPFSYKMMPKTIWYRLTSKVEYLLNRKCFFEKNRNFVDLSLHIKCEYFDGYWQSWRYLEPVKEKLLADFKPKAPLSEKSQSFIDYFEKCNSVFVGVRRGDYLETRKTAKHFGGCSLEYYKRSIEYMCEKIEKPIFVIFSNDIEWAKDNLNSEIIGLSDSQMIYRKKEDVVSDFEELFIMSSCKNAIISNSTFNYWGAWLINNPAKIVIAPQKWFNDCSPIDIIPEEWIKF